MEDVSAEEDPSEKRTWFPEKDGDEEWQKGAGPQACKRQSTVKLLIADHNHVVVRFIWEAWAAMKKLRRSKVRSAGPVWKRSDGTQILKEFIGAAAVKCIR